MVGGGRWKGKEGRVRRSVFMVSLLLLLLIFLLVWLSIDD